MKALVLEEYNRLVYKDMPTPQPGTGEVLIRVKACGICGSDVHGMDGSTGRRHTPLIMGHEASGEIAAVGADVTRWKVGDRVTFDSTVYPLDDWFTLKGRYNLSEGREVVGVSPVEYKRHGAFAEFLVVPQHILYLLPDNVSFAQAAMVEPAAVAAHAVRLSGIRAGNSAVVFGSGMIGTFIVSMLKAAGATPIIAVDIDEEKLKMAAKYGATTTINSARQPVTELVRSLTKGRGADFGFEAIGISATVNALLDTLRKGATATLVGNVTPTIEFPLQKVVTSEIRIQGSCAINGEYEMALDLIASGALNVDDMISAVAPLSDGAEWFRKLYAREGNLNKVILTPPNAV
ncbi:MAG: galactitol-1-phosphate 5-dehydrogenase [Bacteroidales bacterium]|jgi:L-iditol 2-dehydrogenase|nr:galactitol-1-phosphate 5-dehydrogenase [Bacteroidales bacterium]